VITVSSPKANGFLKDHLSPVLREMKAQGRTARSNLIET
jgi:hypothetical protein